MSDKDFHTRYGVTPREVEDALDENHRRVARRLSEWGYAWAVDEIMCDVAVELLKGGLRRWASYEERKPLGAFVNIHSYSIYDIPKTGDFYKDERLWIKENKKLFLERKYLSFENMTVEQQREIMDEPTINSCYICSSSFEKDIEKYPFNPKYGVNESDVFHMVQCLQQENRESVNFLYDPKQQKEGLSILKEIFETITSVQESDGIRYVYKLLKKKEFFKHWKKEEKRISVKFAELALQRLLEIMGYLSILHTEKYRGSFYEFNEGCTPRSSRSSDWNYPVDFWRGKNGIDKIAFQYWFGEYDELEKFWKQ